MLSCATGESLTKPANVKDGNAFDHQEFSGKICRKFIELIRYENITCEVCEFNVGRSMTDKETYRMLSKCKEFDCMADVHPCDDYGCPKNIFYSKMKGVKHHENDMSRIARNCEWGIRYFFGTLTLEQVADLYGLCKERIRQIEAEAFIHVGNKIRFNKDLSVYIPPDGPKYFQKLLDDRDSALAYHNARSTEQRREFKNLGNKGGRNNAYSRD
ncbi:MAG: hypothetical protein RBG13Loki_3109 [Promethearchaeota archaeon CR_4]|nr:MAG: hypothetical protein RBG13Loki_3109 [Candidatus Lokiarchaeota archaeon CR_4]